MVESRPEQQSQTMTPQKPARPGRKSKTPILDAAAILICVLAVGLLGTLIGKGVAYPAIGFRLSVLAQRVQSFPGAARNRNARCTYWQAWSLSAPVEKAMAFRAVRQELRVERKEGPIELVSTPLGPYWIPVRDIESLAETVEEQQRNLYEGSAAVQPGDIVLDCGANIGVYTRHALDRGAKLVVAIEPAPESLACLRRNVEKEIASGRVVVYPKGVWNQDAELQISISGDWASTAASVVLDRGPKGVMVPLTTIDKLVAELQLPRVDFIKMDIEGAESQALEGALETVRRFRPRMSIAVEHRPSDPDTIPVLVQRLWPSYVAACGPCTNVNGSIQPDILYARAR